MTEAQRAHLRMIETLPKRTHHADFSGQRYDSHKKKQMTPKPPAHISAERREIIRGMMDDQDIVIAEKLGISPPSVRKHKAAILEGK